MKIFLIIFVCFIVCIETLCSQVGINTRSPQGVFDLRVSEGVNQKGLVVTNNGTVIIGQSTSSSDNARLVVEGTMMIRTGQEADGSFYSINELGVMDWHNITLGSEYSVWRLSSSSFKFVLAADNIMTGTSALSVNDLGMSTGTNSLFLPKGRYLVLVYGDVSGNEFGDVSLYQINNNQVLLEMSYFGFLSGGVTYLDVVNPVEVGVKFFFNDMFDPNPVYYPRTFFYEFSFLKLSN